MTVRKAVDEAQLLISEATLEELADVLARGAQIAAVVTARKLAVLVWHLLTKEEDFPWARPSLNETKRRTQELKVEMPAAKGQCEHAHPDR